LKAREQTRDTARLTISLDEEIASRMTRDPNMRAFVFCAAESYDSAWKPVDIAFPTHAELKVNQEDVKVNLKGLKNKPGSTRPVDITSFIRKKSGFPNSVELVYALTNKVRLYPPYPSLPVVRRRSHENLLCAYRLHLHRSTSFS
jgi:E3 SUMO-protein ligase PIAS1